ncbi:hypothetical protein SARC_10366 [Sphaeroforma arctica JP610]|uniref:Phosphatidylinositol transfer protein N-terminal domain-containing protein n=1 Tax=Sphaeroforma arctica JP610 TaxID=667725 RepID=A0A0L0FMA9_9EUKA|nr:hypothetical protein SARC_10366 [Sphaeroforma arctica JP610]KNC77168.1 hypothetical protein SARC_10366 [Sphaeroforma arctica JP610]|eukprot:XP_014151070.1 hypothetical protein SARC_10366 [Sphaeroforma arctica JP610]
MKIYHVGSHMPGWIKSIMPKTALEVHEEAWNAYPYTKTIFSIPFVNKFSIDIETVYKGGRGTEHDNALNLTKSELAQREVFDINLLTTTPADPTDKGYEPLEDPAVYVSQRTGRGPLQPEWEKTHNPVMCAYKVCKVNFKYWGLQSKLENFIADVGLRRTIVGAHRQAWCWQDEWIDLNMEDVLKMEEEAQRKLAEVFAKPGDGTSADESTTALTNSDTRATAQSASASQDEGLDGRNTNLSILENVDSAPPLQKVYSSMTTDMDTDEATSGSDSVEFWSGNEEFDDADEDQYSESADPNSTAAGLPRLHLQPPSDSGVRRRHLVIASFAPSIISSSAGSDADWASDFNTFKRTVKQVAESHYSEGVDCMEIVPIRTGPILGEGTPPTMTTELEAVLRGMSKSNDLANFSPSALIGSVVMHPTYDSRLQEMVQVLNATLQHYSDFEFQGGSVTIICDRISGLLMYDVLSRPELCDQVHLPIDYCYTLGAPIGFVLGQRYLQSLAHTSTGVLRTPGPTPVRHTPHTLTATSSPSPLASTTVSMSATASTESGTGVPLFFEPDVNRQIPPLSPTTESKSAGGSANNTDADISTQAIGVPVLRAQPPQMPR